MEVVLKTKNNKMQDLVMESSLFEHFHDLTRPKYAEKYEDSESGLKSIHFLTKTPQKHDCIVKFWTFFDDLFLATLFEH